MKVSILIANYNNGSFLEDAIQSVFQQAYKDWEIIIVDDGSSDDSDSIYQFYTQNKKIQIFKNNINKGCGYTKARCIELAGGEICGFLDPDDTLTPDALEQMVNAHLDNPMASLIYSTHFLTDEKLQIISVNPGVGPLLNGESQLNHTKYGMSHFVTFKKKFYNQTAGLDPTLKRAVDQDLYLKLEEISQVLYIDKPLYFYRQHKKSISLGRNELKAFYWNLKVKSEAYQRRKKVKSAASNISKKKLSYYYYRYYTRMAYQKATMNEIQKMHYLLFKALPHFAHDKNFAILRIALIPYKKWFFNLTK